MVDVTVEIMVADQFHLQGIVAALEDRLLDVTAIPAQRFQCQGNGPGLAAQNGVVKAQLGGIHQLAALLPDGGGAARRAL